MIHIEADTIAEAYALLCRKVLKHGKYQVNDQTTTIGTPATVVIYHPFREPRIHPDFPTKKKHLEEYMNQWYRSYDWKGQGFEYNYMDRLVNYNGIDQLEIIKNKLKKKDYSRRLKAITWMPDKDLCTDNPPCLNALWFRRSSEKTVEVQSIWRSRDCFSAFNSNVVALLAMISREILVPLELDISEYIEFISNAHVYNHDFESAKRVKLLPPNPQILKGYIYPEGEE